MAYQRFNDENYLNGPTLNMVLDALAHKGFQIFKRAESPYRGLNRISILSELSNVKNSKHTDDATLYLINKNINKDTVRFLKNSNGAVIIFFENIDTHEAEDFLDTLPFSLTDNVAIAFSKNSQSLSFQSFLETISNFMLEAIEYVNSLELVAKSSVSFQEIIDIAECWFGQFMHITDANNILLAYTKNITPPDEIHESLIDLGHHSKEWLHAKENIDVHARYYGYHAISVFPKHLPFSTNLATAVLTIKGRYYAHIVLTYSQDQITSGILDSFELFIIFCQRLAERRCKILTSKDFASASFLAKLLTEDKLENAFVHQQANKLDIPIHASFAFTCIYAQNATSQAELNNLAEMLNTQLTHRHKTLIFEDSIGILFFGNSWKEAMDTNVQVADSKLITSEYKIYSSDIYDNLKDTYFAYKQIKVIKKYANLVHRTRILTQSKGFNHIITFHDVFCFFWDDPYSDTELRDFSIRNTRLARMEADDLKNETNNVDLLNAYLMHERKATPVGEMLHMHRNGIIYRIEKIESYYQICLDEFMTRQYLQMCIRIKMCAEANDELIQELKSAQTEKEQIKKR